MDKIELTPEQQQAVLDFWNQTPNNPPAVKDIVRHIFGEGFDIRTPQYKSVTSFLASRNMKQRIAKPAIELTSEQKEYISNNSTTMNALEMAKILFANHALTNLNGETRAVNEFLKGLTNVDVIADTDDVPSGDYIPPDTVHKVLRKVNQYTSNDFKFESLSPQLKKGLEALMKYLNNYHVVKQINFYDSQDDRKSFEDAFIRYTYNKPDLSQEEVGQYCVLANEIVLAFKAQRRSEKLQKMMEEITDKGLEGAKISMSLVESISKATNEYNQCIVRQQKLLDDLTEKRSDKLSKQIKDNASVLNLLHAWKHEENRKKWLKLAEIEDRAIEGEIEKMVTIEEIKAKILGLTKDEARYG